MPEKASAMETGKLLYVTDDENFKATELRLGLPGIDGEYGRSDRRFKRSISAMMEESAPAGIADVLENDRSHESAPIAKAQAVGWPPIRAYRKNNLQLKKPDDDTVYVKVSMDGAPYLRKIDLNVYKGYEELRVALEDMFKPFILGNLLPIAVGGSDYAVAYEDKEGDWMLAGDVPWRMFISSCKRLRIMKGSEAKGLSSNS